MEDGGLRSRALKSAQTSPTDWEVWVFQVRKKTRNSDKVAVNFYLGLSPLITKNIKIENLFDNFFEGGINNNK